MHRRHEYKPTAKCSTAYQSEAELEAEFIRMLQSQGYEYVHIETENDLVSNLRRQIEILNGMQFTDSEWIRFFNECIASSNDGILPPMSRFGGGNRDAQKKRVVDRLKEFFDKYSGLVP